MVTQTQTKTEVLSYEERQIIASVLSWDAIDKTFSADEIEAIRIEGDMVWVKLTNGAWPISRNMFRSILEAQRAAITKQIEEIDEKIEKVAQPTSKKVEKKPLPAFINLGQYRGWNIFLISMKDNQLAPHGKYWVEITNTCTFQKVISQKLFSNSQKEGAIAYAKALIEWDKNFCVINAEANHLPTGVF